MKPGIQTLFAEAGEAACYALSGGDVADEYLQKHGRPGVDPCQALLVGIDKKRIYYNPNDENDEKNFYVDNMAGFLEDLTGVRWEVTKAAPDAVIPPGSYVIERWERVKTGAVLGHFARTKAPRPFNSLTRSLCVERGTLVSLRICTPLD